MICDRYISAAYERPVKAAERGALNDGTNLPFAGRTRAERAPRLALKGGAE